MDGEISGKTKERKKVLRHYAAVEALTFLSSLVLAAIYIPWTFALGIFLLAFLWFTAVNAIVYRDIVPEV